MKFCADIIIYENLKNPCTNYKAEDGISFRISSITAVGWPSRWMVQTPKCNALTTINAWPAFVL